MFFKNNRKKAVFIRFHVRRFVITVTVVATIIWSLITESILLLKYTNGSSSSSSSSTTATTTTATTNFNNDDAGGKILNKRKIQKEAPLVGGGGYVCSNSNRHEFMNCPAFPSYSDSCLMGAEQRRVDYLIKNLNISWDENYEFDKTYNNNNNSKNDYDDGGGISIRDLHNRHIQMMKNIGQQQKQQKQHYQYYEYELISKLQSIFNQRRIVFLGDSLMRQWYETISCRLGLEVQYFNLLRNESSEKKQKEEVKTNNMFTDNNDPYHRLSKLSRSSGGMKIFPLNQPQLGYMKGISGYSVASTKKRRKKRLSDDDDEEEEEERVDNNNEQEDDDYDNYCGFETTLEYIKFNKIPAYQDDFGNGCCNNLTSFLNVLASRILPPPPPPRSTSNGDGYDDDDSNNNADTDPDPDPDIFTTDDYFDEYYDYPKNDPLIIFNIGAHYKQQRDNDKYEVAMEEYLRICGSLNSASNTIRCIYRDNFPQHHILKGGPTSKNKLFPNDWNFDPTKIHGGKCGGPFQSNVNPIIFNERQKYYDLAKRYNVPIIRIVDDPIWSNAWNWHHGGDCMHYCPDPILWDTIHWKLVTTLMVNP